MSNPIQVAFGRDSSGLASEEVGADIEAGAVAMTAERTSTSESLSIFVTSCTCNIVSAGEGWVAHDSANDDVVLDFRRLGLAFFGFLRNTDCSFWPTCRVPCRTQQSHVTTLQHAKREASVMDFLVKDLRQYRLPYDSKFSKMSAS